MTAHRLWQLAREAAVAWRDDYGPSMGAALAYYSLFSIAPLLLLAVSVAGLAYGDEAARGELATRLHSLIGEPGAAAVQGLLKGFGQPREGAIGSVIGLALLLLGAFSVLGELQNALDRIWRAPPRTGAGLWSLLRSRLLWSGLVLGVGFLLVVSLAASAAVAALGARWWPGSGPGAVLLAEAIDFGVSFVLVGVAFALIYKLMPRVPVLWRDVWLGAVATALLFALGKVLIGLYIGMTAFGSGFGAAAALVVLLVWTYYSAQLFLLGAEFTRAHSLARSSLAGSTGSASTRAPAADGASPCL